MSQYVINGVGAVNIELLLNGATAPGAGAPARAPRVQRTFHAWLPASGGTARVDIEVSNDPSALASPSTASWKWMGSIYLSGANDVSGFESSAPWAFARANLVSASGATVSVAMGH